MILDSSALVAVILEEPGAEALRARIKAATAVGIGAATLAETMMVLARRLGGDPTRALSRLLLALEVEVIPLTEEHSHAALRAYLRFGKGRHPAALNFGGCLAYATAAVARQPLLFVGADFSKTDLIPA